MKMANTGRSDWGIFMQYKMFHTFCTNFYSIHIYRSLQKQTKEGAMSPAYQEQPTSGHTTTGLVRLYMETVQEGKAFCMLF